MSLNGNGQENVCVGFEVLMTINVGVFNLQGHYVVW